MRNRNRIAQSLLVLLALFAAGCVRSQPQVVVITATPDPLLAVTVLPGQTPVVMVPTPATPFDSLTAPTPDPTRAASEDSPARQYTVQPGDTLTSIAAANGISLGMLLTVNDLANPDVLVVGQVINLPAPPDSTTSDFKIIPDSRLVRAPGAGSFNVGDFVSRQTGYIRQVTDLVNLEFLTASQVIERVSLEFSVDARLLLALLEYRSGWLTNPNPSDSAKEYPMEMTPTPDGFDRSGFYRQMAWAANQLNRGYYGWRYGSADTIEFAEGIRLRIAPGLNAGTAGVQYFLSRNTLYGDWAQQVGPNGFFQLYQSYFGNPFLTAVDPLVPPGIQQPALTLPFSAGETWFFTGGPHGGWGSGSAWAAVDFAPPDERPDGSSSCYVSEYWVTAIAAGAIARSGQGSVILDLDGDGDETTGWTILYLHIASQDQIAAGVTVQPGDRIGRPSCEGGFSNATHMHIARRYNGEWIPADCETCPASSRTPPFVLGGWAVHGLPGQEYQGYLLNGVERRTAEQGRLAPDNRVSW